MVAFALRLNPYWMGKHSIFKAPFGGLMRWLGGIRSTASSQQPGGRLGQAIRDADGPLQLIVPPEGTRSKTRYWKTGFYYIAQAPGAHRHGLHGLRHQAQRPGAGVQPTGDIDADMAAIKAFYAPFQGKNAGE
jgi:1-acyl-sn-glycerol-3-phosphate acyltransferase